MQTIDEVIQEYIRDRSKLDELRQNFKSIEKEIKSVLEAKSMWLRDRADELGVESFKTAHGTSFRIEKTRVTVSDWPTLLSFVKSTQNWQILEKRVAKVNTLDLLTEEKIEPSSIGLDLFVDVDMQVRKP